MCRCIRRNGNWDEHSKRKQPKMTTVQIKVRRGVGVPLAESLVLNEKQTQRLAVLNKGMACPVPGIDAHALTDKEEEERETLRGIEGIMWALDIIAKDFGEIETVRMTADLASEFSDNPVLAHGVVSSLAHGFRLSNLERNKPWFGKTVVPTVMKFVHSEEMQECLNEKSEKSVWLGADVANQTLAHLVDSISGTIEKMGVVTSEQIDLCIKKAEKETMALIKKMKMAKKAGDAFWIKFQGKPWKDKKK